jgi:hypothetical protein
MVGTPASPLTHVARLGMLRTHPQRLRLSDMRRCIAPGERLNPDTLDPASRGREERSDGQST